MTWKRLEGLNVLWEKPLLRSIATILSLPANPPPAKPATSRQGEFIPDLVWVVMSNEISYKTIAAIWTLALQVIAYQRSKVSPDFKAWGWKTHPVTLFWVPPIYTRCKKNKKNEVIQLGMGSSLEPLKWDFHRISNSFKLEMTSTSVVPRVKCLSKKRLWTASRA